jgi:outer membrane protein assembly factor BamB
MLMRMTYRDDLEAAHARVAAAEAAAATAEATLADVLQREASNLVTTAPPAIFVGIGGHVVAVATVTGMVLWQHKLTMSGVVTVVYDQGVLLAGVAGELYRLDINTGEVLWHNKLRGYGLGLPCLVIVPHPVPPLATVFVGIASSIIALDVATGTARWTNKLTSSMLAATGVHLALLGGQLFATIKGELYCVDANTGTTTWHNELEGRGQSWAAIAPTTTSPFDIAMAQAAAQASAGT